MKSRLRSSKNSAKSFETRPRKIMRLRKNKKLCNCRKSRTQKSSVTRCYWKLKQSNREMWTNAMLKNVIVSSCWTTSLIKNVRKRRKLRSKSERLLWKSSRTICQRSGREWLILKLRRRKRPCKSKKICVWPWKESSDERRRLLSAADASSS